MFAALAQPHLCGAGRPDAAAHPGAPGRRRPLRHRPGAALFDVSAGGIKAPARAGECAADPPPPERTRAFAEAAGRANEAGLALDRGVPAFLGRQPRPPGRLPEGASSQGEKIMTSNKAGEDYTGREFTFTREYDAPRELVFRAWTDPRHVAQWWGPGGFTNPVCEWDARPGNAIHVVMRAPDGTEHGMGGEFREVVAPERLVFTAGALDG